MEPRIKSIHTLALLLALLSAPFSAHALGFGSLTLQSHLHEPLKAQVPLVLAESERPENITVELAGPADYRQLNLHWNDSLTTIRVLFQRDASRTPYIKLRSVGMITTPILSIILKARKAGHGTYYKHFKILLDPASSPIPIPAPASSATMLAGSIALPLQPTSEKPLAQQTPSSGWARSKNYGPTRSGDSLSEIASRLRRDKRWSNRQVMLALFDKNRAAFVDGDINYLQRGAWLSVPSAEEIEQHDVVAASGKINQLLAKSAAVIEPGQSIRANEPTKQGPTHNIHVSLDRPAAGKAPIQQQPKSSDTPPSEWKYLRDAVASGKLDIEGLGQSVAGLSKSMAGLRQDMQALKREVALIKAAPAQPTNSSPDYWMLAFFVAFFIGLGVFIALFYRRQTSRPWKNPVVRDLETPDHPFADAEEQFKPAAANGDNQLTDRIEESLGRGEYEKVEQLLLQMERAEPGSLRASVLRTQLYHETGNIELRNELINTMCESSDEQRWKRFCHLLPSHVWNACFGDGNVGDKVTA